MNQPTEPPAHLFDSSDGPCTDECVATHPDHADTRGELYQPADEWVGALVRLKGDPPEGHARIGTVRRISPDGLALVAGQFTGNLAWAYPVTALERIQIVVLP